MTPIKIFIGKHAVNICFYIIFADCFFQIQRMKRFAPIFAITLCFATVSAQIVPKPKEDERFRNLTLEDIQRVPAGTVIHFTMANETPPLSTPKVGDINKLFAVCEEGRWGMVDIEGNFAIPPIYEALKAISCNHMAVKHNGKWGYLDKNGQMDIPCIYEEAVPFENGYALVRQDNRWGLLDSTGRSCIRCDYDRLFPVREGLVAACSEGLWGFLDTKGSLEIPFAYEAVTSFRNGRAGFRINGKWGIMNRKGEILIDARFDNLEW
jgi:hypothetical protein